MSESPLRRSRWHALIPRFSLRALLVAVLLIAISIPLGQRAWRRYVEYRDAQQYAAMQDAKKWPPGQPNSVSIDDGRGIPNDYVILVRSGKTFGCFVPRNQYKRGESLEYEWYYRTDGGGKFDPRDPNVKSGHSFSGVYVSGGGILRVKFGPFAIEWSGNGPGWGFLYYDGNNVSPDSRGLVAAPRGALRICSTDVKDLGLIDARDARWIYKYGRRDPGLAGDKDEGDAVAPQTEER